MTARPWLAPGLTPASRATLLHGHIASLGWRVSRVGGARSMAAPWGVVRLAVDAVAGLDTEAAILAHEATHARQMGRGVLGRWWWALRYLVSPWHRRRVELEAEAHEAACWAAMLGTPLTVEAMVAVLEDSARALGGWRWPHLTGGDRDELLHEAALGALALVIDAGEPPR